jgi:hypothetical protein
MVPTFKLLEGKRSRRKLPKPQRVTLLIDLMFLSGSSLLVGYARPICMLMCNWIKGKGVLAVKRALDRQKVPLTWRYRAAVREQQLLLRVSIHGPNTDSAHVDVMIKQLKNVSRAITVLPFLLPLSLLMYAVFYACAKT